MRKLAFDVLFVGGGPANLTAAIHLTNLIKQHNANVSAGKETGHLIDYENKIAVLEKGAYFGAHNVSGGILDPIALNILFPNHKELGFPIDATITDEAIYYLTKNRSFKVPFIPPFLENRGNYIVSLSKMTTWMAKQAEKNDVVLLKEVAAVELLDNEKSVIGVKTDNRRKDPTRPGGFRYPGYQLDSKVTVLGEGSAGYLSKKAITKYKLDEGKSPAIYELGVKEIYDLKEGAFPAGKCLHVMGYPLGNRKSGGAFMYGMAGNKLALGMITHLSTKDPYLDVHQDLQKFKLHPMIKAILDQGQVVSYGAKTLPCGGYYTMPKPTYPGLMILGDGANLVDSRKLKGLHTAMQSGILAAETLFDAYVRGDFSHSIIQTYEDKLEKSFIASDLKKSRNFGQALGMGVPFPGGPLIGFQLLTGGANITGKLKTVLDFKKTKSVNSFYGSEKKAKIAEAHLAPDDKFVIDKLSDVFLSRAIHDEHQDSHIILKDHQKCVECLEQFHGPCRRFCPAQVYELDESSGDVADVADVSDVSGITHHKPKIMVNFSNCLHCKTCDLKCPQDNIIWNLPEAGGGPQYTIQ